MGDILVTRHEEFFAWADETKPCPRTGLMHTPGLPVLGGVSQPVAGEEMKCGPRMPHGNIKPPESILAEIRQARRSQGLTWKEVVQHKTSKDSSKIADQFRGRYTIKREVFETACETLGIPVDPEEVASWGDSSSAKSIDAQWPARKSAQTTNR